MWSFWQDIFITHIVTLCMFLDCVPERARSSTWPGSKFTSTPIGPVFKMPMKVWLDASSIAEQMENVSSFLQGNMSSFSQMSGVETGMDMDDEIEQLWREIAEKEQKVQAKQVLIIMCHLFFSQHQNVWKQLCRLCSNHKTVRKLVSTFCIIWLLTFSGWKGEEEATRSDWQIFQHALHGWSFQLTPIWPTFTMGTWRLTLEEIIRVVMAMISYHIRQAFTAYIALMPVSLAL